VLVALNAQLLSFARTYRGGGISRVIYHQLRILRRLESEFRFVTFVPALSPHPELESTRCFRVQRTAWPTQRPLARIAWEQLVQPVELLRWRADLHHSLSYALPLAWRGRALLTIFDLSFLRFPELFTSSNRAYKATLARLSARRARRVITISEHGKREVVALLGVPPERVAVAYPGVDEQFRPLPVEHVEAFRVRNGLPRRFILFLGTLEPRKNALGLVRAYARLRRETALPHKLVLVGGVGWMASPLYREVQQLGLQDDVIFAGYVDSAEQALWYNAADAFAYPSLYEGFGLPPLEAMACGVPVITSNCASLPEVVGDAGRLVDPRQPEALAAALAEVLADATLRDRMSAAGLAQARRFTWEAMGQRLLDVYRAVAAETHA
jgi:glycosyltransferase involved in cell wall biosynthesis